MKIVSTLLLALLLFTGCAGKKFFEPEDSESFDASSSSLSSDIESINRSGATLEDKTYISASGVSSIQLLEGYEFLNSSNGTILSTNNKDKVAIDSKEIEVGDIVVAASLENNLLALVYANNSIALYDTQKERFVFKEYYKESIVNDTRITSPHFMSNIILFPTLDGKVIVVSKENNQVVKNIVVDPDSTFNNILYLDVINDTLIAASNNKIIAVGTGNLFVKDYEIREVITNDSHIFIATIDGQLIKMNTELDVLGSKKYRFAKFHALAYGGNALYGLESQGYLIKVDDDFVQDTIYDFSFDAESKAIAIKDTIYFGDEYIQFK